MNHTYRPASQPQGKQIPAQIKNCRRLSAAYATFAAGAALAALVSGEAHAQSGLLLYTPNSGSNNVSVYTSNADGTLAATSTLAVGNTPVYAVVRGDQAFAYVTNNNANTLSVIDTQTNAVVQTVAAGAGPRGLAVSPDGRLVYVANNTSGTNTVSVFSADALTGQLSLSTTIATGANSLPRQVVFSQDGSRAYIANQGQLGNNGSISIVNTATNAIIGTVATGGQLSDIAGQPRRYPRLRCRYQQQGLRHRHGD